MRHDDESGIQAEINELMSELRIDVERLNIAADSSATPDDIKHMIAALADKISGISSLMR
ncbi:hypothetical protein [Asaia platycodi]|uniref:hypothetical protein n=1 Tax=Asaia platycodi TaxID=610243 RepID=UPI00047080AE|nr:hypothetical protein [Asaia platycodi]